MDNILQVQEWLINNNKNWNLLTDQLGIKCNFHPELPYVKLVYDQINSPKMHPIVQECRGLVLNTATLGLEGACFRRFFNLGEADEITSKFDWSDFSAYEKIDGSYISIFYSYINNDWIITTKGSFGESEIQPGTPTWRNLVLSLLGDKINTLWKGCTYIFELGSPYNKVVREFRESQLFLLGIFCGDGRERTDDEVDGFAYVNGFQRPERYHFSSVEEIKDFLQKQETEDPTFEGLVVRDVNGLRMKIKSKTYLSLHQLKGNGNIFIPKNLISFILAGECEEVLAYFPEAQKPVEELQKKIDNHWKKLYDVWWNCQDFEEQKKFAIYITKENPTPFSGILFTMKKDGTIKCEETLKSHWRNSADLILKVIG